MRAMVAVGLLVGAAGLALPQAAEQRTAGCPARRNLFSRLGHAVQRIAAAEPALSERLSSWGIRDGAEIEFPDPVTAPAPVCRAAQKNPKGGPPSTEPVQLSARRPIAAPVSRKTVHSSIGTPPSAL